MEIKRSCKNCAKEKTCPLYSVYTLECSIFEAKDQHIFILLQMNSDDEFQVESAHRSEAGAQARLKKLATESGFDFFGDPERYFSIEERRLID